MTDELGDPALGLDQIAVIGMRLPVLRETRMPAVVCELSPARAVVGSGRLNGLALSTRITSEIPVRATKPVSGASQPSSSSATPQ